MSTNESDCTCPACSGEVSEAISSMFESLAGGILKGPAGAAEALLKHRGFPEGKLKYRGGWGEFVSLHCEDGKYLLAVRDRSDPKGPVQARPVEKENLPLLLLLTTEEPPEPPETITMSVAYRPAVAMLRIDVNVGLVAIDESVSQEALRCTDLLDDLDMGQRRFVADVLSVRGVESATFRRYGVDLCLGRICDPHVAIKGFARLMGVKGNPVAIEYADGSEPQEEVEAAIIEDAPSAAILEEIPKSHVDHGQEAEDEEARQEAEDEDECPPSED